MYQTCDFKVELKVMNNRIIKEDHIFYSGIKTNLQVLTKSSNELTNRVFIFNNRIKITIKISKSTSYECKITNF